MRGLNSIRKEVPKPSRALKDKREKREKARLKKLIKEEIEGYYVEESTTREICTTTTK